MSDPQNPREPRRPERQARPDGAQGRPSEDDASRDPFDYESIFHQPVETWKDRVPQFDRLPIIGAVVGCVLVLLLTSLWVSRQFDPAGGPGSEVTVEVKKGATLSSVGSLLQKRGVIPSAMAFKLWAKIDEGVPNLQAGEYTFHTNTSAGGALAVLRAGPKQTTDKLVIPEGFRLAQIAQRVGSLPGMSAQKFTELAESGAVRSTYQPAGSKDLEGFLFPDTYTIGSSDNEQTLLERMVRGFDAQAQLVGLDASASRIGRSPYETLIIASLIESEAKTPDDRGKISQVIENRLRKPMALQIDATVLYALGNTKQSLSNSDLRVQSKYNTYLAEGLPPGAISNPGRASLLAALQPTPGPWLYYVVKDADGNHAFATTLDEHNRNVAAARTAGVCC